MDCIKCGVELTDDEMKDYKRNYIRTCKKCRDKYLKKWIEDNPNKIKKIRDKHSTKNSILTRNYQKEYYRKLKEKVILHYSPNHICQWPNCEWSDSDVLSVDHIDNNGAEHFRELGFSKKGNQRRGGGSRFYLWLIRNDFPKGFQILCMNHQWKKRADFYKEKLCRRNLGKNQL